MNYSNHTTSPCSDCRASDGREQFEEITNRCDSCGVSFLRCILHMHINAYTWHILCPHSSPCILMHTGCCIHTLLFVCFSILCVYSNARVLCHFFFPRLLVYLHLSILHICTFSFIFLFLFLLLLIPLFYRRRIWGSDDTVFLKSVLEACKNGQFRWIGNGQTLTSTSHVENVCEGLVCKYINWS